jgi:limonene-1,2-epoxide hydrolase
MRSRAASKRFEARDGEILHWRDYSDTGNLLLGVIRGAVKAAAVKVLRR